MSELKNEGRLQKLKGKVQSTWGSITNDDFDRANGDRNQLIGSIKERTGQAEEDIRKTLEKLEEED